ncbi:hypothetical protein DVR12_19220 [Chitinophaga silvatica]|uniref:Outer membrane protein beta-barrel domain-containing protein n=1 Tax=Chitinophaga silvatica TaxID=2282649 RepID=A0A3E1Y710_9BACT|nr:hypothetical protein [Chitinophaga silvatica]RFS20691.1 hypothetical protein DVR12_19220 [Chitinophaga silvatica]
MKKMLLLLLFLPLFGWAQDSKLINGYGYLMLHDSKFGGGVVGNVNLLNQYLGAGPGVEITSYNGRTLVPVFADVKLKHRWGMVEPFLTGQFGYNAYNATRTDLVAATDGTSKPITFNQSGKFFYGAGGGVSFHLKSVGIFASYIYRGYKYSRPTLVDVDNQAVRFGSQSVSANVFIIGIVF